MLTAFLKIKEKSKYPISDCFRVVAMLLVLLLTLIAIKIGGIFSHDNCGVKPVENIQLTEKSIYFKEDIDTIKSMSS